MIDIVECNATMVLGLIWTLICESGIKGSLKTLGIATAPESPAAEKKSSIVTGSNDPFLPPLRVQGKVVSQGFTGDGIKEALKKWCQNRVASLDVRIDNFQGSFADGIALCALMHSINPFLVAFPPPNVRNEKLLLS